jgi:FSR family fosmidomycin resistance protein-like MFS transporter
MALKKHKNFVLVSLLFSHFTVDWYAGILKPLLPIIMTEFVLTEGTAALIPSLLGVATALLQPFGAYLGFRFGESVMVVVSIILSAIFIPLIGISHTIFLLVLYLSIGMLGNSFFHPNAAVLVHDANFEKSHTAMSIFSIGGTFGSALAPVMILYFVGRFGMRKMPYLAIFGVIALGMMLYSLFFINTKNNSEKKVVNSFRFLKALSEKGVKELLTVNILRSLVIMGLSIFIPLYVVQINYPPIWGGYFLTGSRITGMLGTYLGAILSDKFNPRTVNIFSLLFGTISLGLFFLTKNIYMMLSWFLIAFLFLFATMGANVVYMQDLLPSQKGAASSLGMGISWGIASILISAISMFVDRIGLFSAMLIVTFFGFIAFLLSFMLVLPQRKPDEN